MTANPAPRANFAEFLVVWNRLQGQATPAIHKTMARWLEGAWEEGQTRLLLMAFRSSGKSTICGIFAAWLLYARPDLRILVLAADFALAKKMVRNVRRIIEKHPFTAHLKPQRAEQWASDRFTIARGLELRDPSMLARGVSSNITGSRADVIICDDVEVPGTCDTAEKRGNLREWLLETSYVLVPGGTHLYIGTPHSYHTLYADRPHVESGEETAFLEGFERLVIPVIDENGGSAWPEKYSPADIERMKTQSGPNKFSSQMLLRPVNIAEGRLDVEALQFYGGGIEYSKELDQLHINGKVMASVSAWWDPSLAKHGGDASVLAVVYTEETGAYWLHALEYIKLDVFDQTEPARQQCKKVAFTAQLLRLTSLTIESNGLGGILPGLLREEMAKLGIPCSVQEKANTRPKDLRILDAFDPVLAARMLHVNAKIKDTPFIGEMLDWKPGLKNTKDDGLDAVACAIAQGPVRTQRFYTRGGHTWTKGIKGRKARTEFEI
jgi:hypothetical protein